MLYRMPQASTARADPVSGGTVGAVVDRPATPTRPVRKTARSRLCKHNAPGNAWKLVRAPTRLAPPETEITEDRKIAARDLTKGSIPRHLVTLSVPVALAMGLQSVYAIIDLAFVSRLGETAVAGLAISLQAFFIVLAISQMVATTALAEISQAYGADDVGRARGSFAAFSIAAVAVGAFAAVVAYVSAPVYVGLFARDEAVMAAGLGYFRVTALTFLLQVLLIVFGGGLRASGDFMTPMKLMTVSVLTNLALDPLLIFGLGPFPELGLNGAAWATVISQALAVSIYAVRLIRPRTDRGIYWTRPRWSSTFFGRLLTRGVPAAVQYFLISAVLGIVLAGVRPYGATWTATAGAGFRVLQQTFLPVIALASAASAISGQNLGAGNPMRVKRAALTALGWTLVYATVVSAMLFLGAPIVGRLFSKGAAELDVAAAYFHWSAPMLVAFAMTYVPTFVLQAAGRTVRPLAAALVRVSILAVLIMWAIPTYELPPVYVFGATTATALLEGVLGVLFLSLFVRKIQSPAAT